jgi:hypothetical protein
LVRNVYDTIHSFQDRIQTILRDENFNLIDVDAQLTPLSEMCRWGTSDTPAALKDELVEFFTVVGWDVDPAANSPPLPDCIASANAPEKRRLVTALQIKPHGPSLLARAQNRAKGKAVEEEFVAGICKLTGELTPDSFNARTLKDASDFMMDVAHKEFFASEVGASAISGLQAKYAQCGVKFAMIVLTSLMQQIAAHVPIITQAGNVFAASGKSNLKGFKAEAIKQFQDICCPSGLLAFAAAQRVSIFVLDWVDNWELVHRAVVAHASKKPIAPADLSQTEIEVMLKLCKFSTCTAFLTLSELKDDAHVVLTNTHMQTAKALADTYLAPLAYAGHSAAFAREIDTARLNHNLVKGYKPRPIVEDIGDKTMAAITITMDDFKTLAPAIDVYDDPLAKQKGDGLLRLLRTYLARQTFYGYCQLDDEVAKYCDVKYGASVEQDDFANVVELMRQTHDSLKRWFSEHKDRMSQITTARSIFLFDIEFMVLVPSILDSVDSCIQRAIAYVDATIIGIAANIAYGSPPIAAMKAENLLVNDALQLELVAKDKGSLTEFVGFAGKVRDMVTKAPWYTSHALLSELKDAIKAGRFAVGVIYAVEKFREIQNAADAQKTEIADAALASLKRHKLAPPGLLVAGLQKNCTPP